MSLTQQKQEAVEGVAGQLRSLCPGLLGSWASCTDTLGLMSRGKFFALLSRTIR